MSGSEGRFPKSLIEFQGRFASEIACADYLFERGGPGGFVCPGCGDGRAWLLKTKAFTYECAGCGRQTSVTAGTIMHASKLSLTKWFWAAFLMATHSNGISALQSAPDTPCRIRDPPRHWCPHRSSSLPRADPQGRLAFGRPGCARNPPSRLN